MIILLTQTDIVFQQAKKKSLYISQNYSNPDSCAEGRLLSGYRFLFRASQSRNQARGQNLRGDYTFLTPLKKGHKSCALENQHHEVLWNADAQHLAESGPPLAAAS